MKSIILMAAAASLNTIAGTASAQSDPSLFGTVYNIGSVPAGSIFDVPEAVTGSQIGDDNFIAQETLVTPAFLSGDTLDSGSQLNLFDGGEIFKLFTASPGPGSSNVEVNIHGGLVGEYFFANTGSTINISGGIVTSFSTSQSTVNISGGTILNLSGAEQGSTVNITGGSIDDDFRVFDSTANISGGTVDGEFIAGFRGNVNISGGSVGDGFLALSGSTVNLMGTSFFLDGVELTGSILDGTYTITDRDVKLTGLLADGSAFDFDLNSSPIFGEDFFDPTATLTVTLVPTPGTAGLLLIASTIATSRRSRDLNPRT